MAKTLNKTNIKPHTHTQQVNSQRTKQVVNANTNAKQLAFVNAPNTDNSFKTIFLNKTCLFLTIATLMQLIYVIVLATYWKQIFNQTNAYIYEGCSILFLTSFVVFYFLCVKTERQKSVFLKYLALICFINNLPIFYVSYLEYYFSSPRSEGMSTFHVAQMLFPHTFCTIAMYLGLYLGFAKNKRCFIYGMIAAYFIFTGFFGSIISTVGYLLTYNFTQEPNQRFAVYSMYVNFYGHFPMIVMTIIIIKEKLVKFSFVNTIWTAILCCFSLTLWTVYTKVFNMDFNGHPGFYIDEGLLGGDDKIFKWQLIVPLTILISLGISLFFEFKKFKKEERFYKKFNIFNTYYKGE